MANELSKETLEEITGGASSGKKGKLIIVNCKECCNVRSGPGRDYDRIGRAYLGETYSFTDRKGNWYKIKYHGGKIGWVYQDYIAVVIN